jgi:hypothetical protein
MERVVNHFLAESSLERLLVEADSPRKFFPEDLFVEKIADVLRSQGYAYIPINQLEAAYSGKFPFFKGASWLNRYFSSFYVINQ